MLQSTYTRRQIMKALVMLGLGSAGVGLWQHFYNPDSPFLAIAKKVPTADTASLNIFAALSSFVTLREKLDPATTEHLYKTFMDEPWGADHIVRLYNKISMALLYGVVNEPLPPLSNKAWNLDEGERWFAQHLITTWYLGIYYHADRPTQRATYENALMFAPLKNLVPVPFVDAVGLGAWAKPPADGTL